jgi:hypothetical protein
MSADRTNEYILVVEVRKSIGQVSKDISEATKSDYAKKFERMKRFGTTPENAGTKKSHCRPVKSRIDSVGCADRPRVFCSRRPEALAARAFSRTT